MISIIVPVYNTDKYLERCVNSLLAQTYKNIEIILVDDGSKDNPPKICDEYLKLDSRVRVIHKENSGVSAARNLGILKSKGKYIMFCDSDDYVSPFWCESMLMLIERANIDLGICRYARVLERQNELIFENKDSNKDIKYLKKNRFFELYLSELINMPWNKIYKAEIIKAHNLKMNEDIEYNEDLLFVMEYIKCMKGNFALSNQVLNYYSQGIQGSLTNKYIDNLWEIKKEVFKNMESTLSICGISMHEIKEEYYTKWLWAILCCNTQSADDLSFKKKYLINRAILKSDECKIAFKYASFRDYNSIFSFLLRTRVYLFVLCFEKLLQIKKKLL